MQWLMIYCLILRYDTQIEKHMYLNQSTQNESFAR